MTTSRRRLVPIAIIALSLCCTAERCPFPFFPDVTLPFSGGCSNFSVSLKAGTCMRPVIPCGDAGADQDSLLRLSDPAPIYVRSEQLPTKDWTNDICALPTRRAISGHVGYSYFEGDDYPIPRSGSGTLTFAITPAPSVVVVAADPPTVNRGSSSRLDAQVSGGTPPYAYAWSPATGLDDPAVQSPIASPATTTTYTVTVTDVDGLTATGEVSVTVLAVEPGLTASFTFLRGALDPAAGTVNWTFDASASTGTITRYAWDLLGNGGTAIQTVSAGPVLKIDLPETGALRGTMTLTVTAADGQTATVSREYR